MVSEVIATVEWLTEASAPRIVTEINILARFRSMRVLVVTNEVGCTLERASSTTRVKARDWPVIST
jgi:hypothetical protein